MQTIPTFPFSVLGIAAQAADAEYGRQVQRATTLAEDERVQRGREALARVEEEEVSVKRWGDR